MRPGLLESVTQLNSHALRYLAPLFLLVVTGISKIESTKIQRKTIAEKLLITNASKGQPTRGVSSPIEPRWFRLLCLSLELMRYQSLRRALGFTQVDRSRKL